MDHHLQRMAEGFLKMFMLRSSHRGRQFPAEESSAGDVIVGRDSCYGMPECLSQCAVTQTMPSLFANTQGYHFSFPSSLDCFCHYKSRCSGFGREEVIISKGCSALQNSIKFNCGPEEQRLRDSLGPHIPCTQIQHTVTSAGFRLCSSPSHYVLNFMLTIAVLQSFLLTV